MGLILGAWQFTYMFFALPAGFILDKYGLRISIFTAAIIITLSLITRGLSNNFYHMWLAVALFGIGGPLISVGVPKASSLWDSEKNRAISMGILFTGPMLGGIFSLLTMNSIIMPLLNNNWKLVYFIYSLAPLTAAIIWLFITNKEIALNKKKFNKFSISESISTFKMIIRKKRFVNILILGASGMFLVHGIHGWLPKIINSKGKTVQVKTCHASSQIGYRGEADLMLVLYVGENGKWEEKYYGDFNKIKKHSNYSARDNKNTITLTKIKRIVNGEI